ncbi:hypothetical protein [Gallaecimonas xiamenensis]|uniref:hypothetical protein n=1 Tax=Gallaecimonas xiamenensis TaxID=1207039 RepID=UPI00054F686E|nr:hypothetical protein [Gallaecimonas xiamenensis]
MDRVAPHHSLFIILIAFGLLGHGAMVHFYYPLPLLLWALLLLLPAWLVYGGARRLGEVALCCLAALGLGGAGMALGQGLVHHHHGGMAFWGFAWMLLLCVPVCWLSCTKRPLAQQALIHGLATILMLLGMVAGHQGAALLVQWLPMGLASHLAMLAGMVLGEGIGMVIGLSLAGRLWHSAPSAGLLR